MDRAHVNSLVKTYAGADRSSTFVSYNDAIDLAGEVKRLRRALQTANRKAK